MIWRSLSLKLDHTLESARHSGLSQVGHPKDLTTSLGQTKTLHHLYFVLSDKGSKVCIADWANQLLRRLHQKRAPSLRTKRTPPMTRRRESYRELSQRARRCSLCRNLGKPRANRTWVERRESEKEEAVCGDAVAAMFFWAQVRNGATSVCSHRSKNKTKQTKRERGLKYKKDRLGAQPTGLGTVGQTRHVFYVIKEPFHRIFCTDSFSDF
ncbi:hypothetical protein DFJ77DRAFT_216085 [Powellomyces hirtus]|nr:hypothetical protein DFJ77DRAFT_216085 [Powellomyces hirtus]